MKESFSNIITKIIYYVKKTLFNTSNNVKFEGKKNDVIKGMYGPLLQEKEKEEKLLIEQLKKMKEEEKKLNNEISLLINGNNNHDKKIAAINSFQELLFRKYE